MRPDERTHDRDDQNRNLRNNQQDRFAGQGQSQGQSYRDDDRGLMDRAGEAMDRAGDAVRSWFGGDDNQNQNRGDYHGGDYRNQDRDFGAYGQDGDESRRFQQGHNVGYSGQGYQGGMGSYAHGNQGQFGNPQYGQGMSGQSQYGQGMSGQSQYGQGMSGQSQYGQGGQSSQYGQGQRGMGQGGMSSQYGQGSQHGQNQYGGQSGMGSQYGQSQGQFGQGSMGRHEGMGSRQGMQGGSGQQGNYGGGSSGYQGSQSWRGDQGSNFGSPGQSMGQGSNFGSPGQSMGQSQYGQSSQGGISRGRHVGRGPRGYKRSDERLTEEINEKLTQHPDIDAEEIEVKVQSGEVTLTGTVEDRQTKRMIEDLVEEISGVNELHNQLRVTRNRGSQSQGGQSQSSHQGGLSSSASHGSQASQGSQGSQGTPGGLSSSQGSQASQSQQSGSGFGSSSSMSGSDKGEHSSTGASDKSRTNKSSS